MGNHSSAYNTTDMDKFIATIIVIFAVFSVGANAKKYDRWCCKSNRELHKCQALAMLRIQPENTTKKFDFNCVSGNGTNDCIEKIKSGSADMIILDAGDILDNENDLKVVAAENVGLADASYYAVAAVRKDSDKNLNLNTVTNGHYRTCHTGVGKTAGWNMPMGYFARKGMDASKIKSSCAPGANLAAYKKVLPGGPDKKWCYNCIGDQTGAHMCARNNDEHFYGYQGALDCMTSSHGDVAFIKHSTIVLKDYGTYQLLCQDGTRKNASEWAICNLGRVPSHALVMKHDASDEDAQDVYKRLNDAWYKLGDERFAYDKTTKPATKNLMWGSSVTGFTDFSMKKVIDYLGEDYKCNLKALKNLKDGKPNPPAGCK